MAKSKSWRKHRIRRSNLNLREEHRFKRLWLNRNLEESIGLDDRG